MFELLLHRHAPDEKAAGRRRRGEHRGSAGVKGVRARGPRSRIRRGQACAGGPTRAGLIPFQGHAAWCPVSHCPTRDACFSTGSVGCGLCAWVPAWRPRVARVAWRPSWVRFSARGQGSRSASLGESASSAVPVARGTVLLAVATYLRDMAMSSVVLVPPAVPVRGAVSGVQGRPQRSPWEVPAQVHYCPLSPLYWHTCPPTPRPGARGVRRGL